MGFRDEEQEDRREGELLLLCKMNIFLKNVGGYWDKIWTIFEKVKTLI